MNKRTTSIISYITPLGWLIAFIVGDREGAKFYLNQSLIIVVADIISGILAGIFHRGLFATVSALFGFIVFVLWVIGLIHAINQDGRRIPLVGDIELLN